MLFILALITWPYKLLSCVFVKMDFINGPQMVSSDEMEFLITWTFIFGVKIWTSPCQTISMGGKKAKLMDSIFNAYLPRDRMVR